MATKCAQSSLRTVRWCTSCQRDAFRTLATPVPDVESMYCRLLIPSTCGVCTPSLGVSWGKVVNVSDSELLSRGAVTTLYLPQEAINSMMTILNLARHQTDRGEKLAQFEAQVEHMFKAYTKEPGMAHALRTLAQLICLREQDSAEVIFSTFFQPRAAIFSNKEWFAERLVAEGESVGCLSWAFDWHRRVQTVHQRWTLHRADEPDDDTPEGKPCYLPVIRGTLEDFLNDTPSKPVDLDNPQATANHADSAADQHAMDEIHQDSASIESMTLQPPSDLVGETPMDGGGRTAERRAPHLGPPPFFFSASGDNLSMAEHLRNNGDAGPVRVPEFAELTDQAAEAFCKIVLSEKQCCNLRVKEACDELPKKYTCKERERYVKDMWYLNCHTLPPKISTSIKAEVVSKPKPRPIQAHGTERLALNCPLLGTYERILKARCGRYTIKGRPKQQVLQSICNAAVDLGSHHHIFPLMFDQTAFEFGINDTFKAAEVKMLTKVASLLKSEYAIYPDDLVDKAIAERKKAVDWVMQCKDGRGFRFKHVIEMVTTMRQSGDRGTSSLNWFANALWVCVSLCRPGCYEEFWRELLAGNHRGYFSFPAWDGMGRVTLVMNLEGDDLLGFSTREDSALRMLEVAHAVGWKAKDELVPMSAHHVNGDSGHGHVTYVGYHIYTKDNVPCVVDGQFVMYPELKRFMTTKAWSTVAMEPKERAACEVLNYSVYAQSFEHLEPVACLCRALANGWRRQYQLHSGLEGVGAQMRVTNTAVIRDVEFRTGMAISQMDVSAHLAGTAASHVTERVTETALAMSSHTCGQGWGAVSAEDVLDLVGMVELAPLSSAADLRCRVPPCWWQK